MTTVYDSSAMSPPPPLSVSLWERKNRVGSSPGPLAGCSTRDQTPRREVGIGGEYDESSAMVSKILGPFIPGIFNLLAPKMINEKANQFLWLTQGVSTTACADPRMLSMVSTHHRGGRCWYNRSLGLHAGRIHIRVMRQKVLEGGESELR